MSKMKQHNGSNKLCHKCSEINFDRTLFNSISTRSLGTWYGIRGRVNCPFCRLVTMCVQTAIPQPHVGSEDRLSLSNATAWNDCVMSLFYDGQRSEDYSNYFDLKDKAAKCSKSAYRLIIENESRHGKPVGVLHYISTHEHGERKLFFGRNVNQQEVNWSVLRSWVPQCQDFHLGLCDRRSKLGGQLPQNLRVIDIDTATIITAPKDCEYCAMTYVWGPTKDNRPVLRRNMLQRDRNDREYARLPPNLPRTIVDSMIVARRLGFRFLWNDSLCIIQEDGEQHMNSQIWQMDTIYSSAELTIAAGSGNSAHAGLPGVSVPRQFPQISETIRDLRFAIPLPTYVDVHDDRSLVWNTRGWTLQEKLLSKRLLLFTDQQVYFKCPNAIWCEDTVLEIGRISEDKRRRLDPFRWVSDRTIPTPPGLLDRLIYSFRSGSLEDVDKHLGYLPNYISLIEEYTRRTLTKPSDAIKAIQGLLNTFNQGQYNTSAFAGLLREYIKPSLLWQPSAGSNVTFLPREESLAPSWSWVGWKLSEGCTWHERDYRNTNCDLSLTDPSPTPRPIFTLSTMYVLIRRADGSVDIKKKSYGTKDEDLPDPALPPKVRYHLEKVQFMMCFHTVIHRFMIGERLKKYSSDESDPDCVELFEITDALDNTVGEIWISRRDAHAGQRIARDFILVSFGIGFEKATVPQLYVPQKIIYVQDDSNVKSSPMNTLVASVPEKPKLKPILPSQNASGPVEEKPKRPVQVNKSPGEWSVCNVMLVEWIDYEEGIARRVGLGKIIKTALESSKWRETWIRLA